MYFTREDFLKITSWLKENGVKDTDLPEITTLSEDDLVAVVQNYTNKKINVSNFAKQLFDKVNTKVVTTNMITDEAVTKPKLSTSLQSSIDLADSSVQTKPVGETAWKISKDSSTTEGLPLIRVEFNFWLDGEMNTDNMRIYNYQDYLDNGYKLAIMRKCRYMVRDKNRETEDTLYYKIHHYGYRGTTISKEGGIYDVEPSSSWKIQFLTINSDGIVCFDDGTKLEAKHIIHRNSSGIIFTPRGHLYSATCDVYQNFGIGFIDTTKYIKGVTPIRDYSCLSNIAPFRGFVNQAGKCYFKEK